MNTEVLLDAIARFLLVLPVDEGHPQWGERRCAIWDGGTCNCRVFEVHEARAMLHEALLR